MDEKLSEIIKRIVDEIDPEKIILFGSRAVGGSQKYSDYDICVLKKEIKDKRETIRRIYRKLLGVGVAVDVIVETTDRFEELKDKWFLIYSEIAKRGKVVYEKRKVRSGMVTEG